MKKQRQCQYTMDDLTKCTSFAMNGSDFCYRHNPEISEEEKINASSKGGYNSHSLLSFGEEGWGGGVPLPEMKIEKYQDIVSVLADTINNVRSGKISQKSGSTIGYLSFIMLMAVDKAKAEAKEEKIEKLKAEGKWRPEPTYAHKFYTYKDSYYLDKDGNPLIVERDRDDYQPENPVRKIMRKHKHRKVSKASKKSKSSDVTKSKCIDKDTKTFDIHDPELTRQVLNAYKSIITPEEKNIEPKCRDPLNASQNNEEYNEPKCRDALHASQNDEEHNENNENEENIENEPELEPCGSFD